MGFDSWSGKDTKWGFRVGGGSDWVYRRPKRMKLSTQNAVRKCPHEEKIKGTELAPQSQQGNSLETFASFYFQFPSSISNTFWKLFFPLLRAPALGAGSIQVAALKKAILAQEAPQGFFFPPLFQITAVYSKTPAVLVLCFVPPPLTALHPASSRGAQKRGRGSWRAHHRLDIERRGNSAHTPADVWVWNKSGSLACLGRPP